MSLIDEPRLYENQDGRSASDSDGEEQRIRASLKAGLGPLTGLQWDSFSVASGSLTDVITYYQGGLAGTALATFTATYQTPRKIDVVSGVWVIL